MSDPNVPEEGHKDPEQVENLSEKDLERRKLLNVVLGTGIVASSPAWVRPVVNTVILPAHAQASVFPTTSSFAFTPPFVTTQPPLVTTNAPATTQPPATTTLLATTPPPPPTTTFTEPVFTNAPPVTTFTVF